MKKIRLGRTELMVTQTAFGALPIQRVDMETAGIILRKAHEGGINFFDTARGYSDSEVKIGNALSGVRKEIIIATKSGAQDKKTFNEHLETSLKKLKTDYVDLFQIHNPAEVPDPNDPDSSIAGAIEAKKKGMVRFIGLSNHRFKIAEKAIASGLFDTLQYPINCLSDKKDLKFVSLCKEKDVGLIAMKALSGGLITNIKAAFAFMHGLDNVVPIWGIQRESELDEFLALAKAPPSLDADLLSQIEKDKKELSGNFCRGCGYCLPCPEGIPINMAARMKFLLRRAVYQNLITDEWAERMRLINNCTECGECSEKCPYDLDTPNLLKTMLKDYEAFYASHAAKPDA